MVLLLNVVPLSAFATSSSDMGSANNNTPFYDPGYSCATSGGGTSAFILGDSVTERTQADYIQVMPTFGFTNGQVNIDASSGRTLTDPGTDGNMLSGMAAIAKDKTTIAAASVVVIALGTDGLGNNQGDYNKDIDQAIAAIKTDNSNATIYWVDTIVVGRPVYNSGVINPVNQAIYGEAKTQGYKVISWAQLVDPDVNPQNPSGPEADANGFIDNSDDLGINPTPNGQLALANLVAQTVGTSSAAAQPQTCCPGGSTPPSFGPGTLPSYIKAPYNSIFTAAGNKYNVDPGVLVGIFYDENYGYQNAVSAFQAHEFRNPPPPYGSGPPWPTSPTGAQGPFQFEPGTYASYEIVANGHPPANPNDLEDEAFSAADFLAHLGATNPETESKIENAANSYSGGYPGYQTAAWDIFQQIKTDENGGGGGGGGSTGTSTGSASCTGTGTAGEYYQNPLRDLKELNPARIDEGVDYTASGPIYALGAGTVDYVNTASGWPGGNFISYILSAGPAAGKRVYIAENCVGTTLHVGEATTSNTVLCHEVDAFPFIETGWALPKADFNGESVDLAAAYSVYTPDGTATAYGQNFSELLKSLGAPAGIYQFANQQGGKNLTGTLPAGWPTW